MSLSARIIQKMIMEGLHSSKNLAEEPSDFIDRILDQQEYNEHELSLAKESVYKNIYYAFSIDLNLDEVEKRKLAHLTRLLNIDDYQSSAFNYEVGLAIYKKKFREALLDGDISETNQNALDSVIKTFGLQKRHIKKAISSHALSHYTFVLARALQDGILTEQEMANLENISRRFGLVSKQLSTISVTEKKEILREALSSIKARGQITEEDRDYIRSVVHYINAKELLKPCLMDLDLYERLFAVRNGDLPRIDSGNLILDRSEYLHYKADVTFETQIGGSTRQRKGTFYVGSFKLRFVGPRLAHEIRYKNILKISYLNHRSPKLSLAVSSGKGSGKYRLTKKNSPAALLELQEIIGYLIRKARKLIDLSDRASAYIPHDISSEVWHRDGGACVLCGASEYLEHDHIIPRSKGGDTSVGNLQLLCRKCNSEKSDVI